jgi:PPE-repeat protein
MLGNFSVLPPEINSLRMFVGVGSAPMHSAAAAWDGLCSELGCAAASFNDVTTTLASQSWQGAAAQAMTAVAAPYASWLNAAAASAENAAGQARAVATAFEQARSEIVHPAVVALNRNNVVRLVMSNLFGQNWPAIAATEAQYEEFWAQDVTAMFGYHAGASAAATQLAAIPDLFGWLTLNKGAGNFGLGNTGNANLGFGNDGNGNIGAGNTGNSNIGFGNSGVGNVGIGLSGNNQIGIGGFNSGTGNIGLFNSGTGNIGFYNSGTNNRGLFNSGDGLFGIFGV